MPASLKGWIVTAVIIIAVVYLVSHVDYTRKLVLNLPA